MTTLAEIAGIDPADPEVRLALELARGDRALLRGLVKERLRQQLSQHDVAERLGLTQPTVAAFERHDSDPKLSTIRRYAQVIGVMVSHEVERRWHTLAIAAPMVAKASPVITPTTGAYRQSARVKIFSTGIQGSAA